LLIADPGQKRPRAIASGEGVDDRQTGLVALGDNWITIGPLGWISFDDCRLLCSECVRGSIARKGSMATRNQAGGAKFFQRNTGCQLESQFHSAIWINIPQPRTKRAWLFNMRF
jgi:hypothetical protein